MALITKTIRCATCGSTAVTVDGKNYICADCGARNAATAAAAVGAGAFVQLSAIGADIDSPAAYARTKAEGEAAVRAAIPGAAIVRPSLVFGANDSFTNRFAGLIAAFGDSILERELRLHHRDRGT